MLTKISSTETSKVATFCSMECLRSSIVYEMLREFVVRPTTKFVFARKDCALNYFPH